MRSNAAKPTLVRMTAKKYLLKIRANSGYLGGLVLVQLLALGLALSSASALSISTGSTRIVLHTYTSQLVVAFSVVWSFIVAIVVSSRRSKDISFTFPGNRLTDNVSDFAFLLTCCVFGAVTSALFGVALRLEMLVVFPGDVLALGFRPDIGDLYVIAAASFMYMLLMSAVGYFAGTLFRLSKLFVVVVTALLIFSFFSILNWTNGPPFWGVLWKFLFNTESLASFALVSAAVAACLYAAGAVLSSFLEVKK